MHTHTHLSLCFLSLAGTQSLLPALWLRASFLCGQTHRHGDDEGHPGHSPVSVHCVSSSRLHVQQHQADQQPVTAASERRAHPGHALHPTNDITPQYQAAKHNGAFYTSDENILKWV